MPAMEGVKAAPDGLVELPSQNGSTAKGASAPQARPRIRLERIQDFRIMVPPRLTAAGSGCPEDIPECPSGQPEVVINWLDPIRIEKKGPDHEPGTSEVSSLLDPAADPGRDGPHRLLPLPCPSGHSSASNTPDRRHLFRRQAGRRLHAQLLPAAGAFRPRPGLPPGLRTAIRSP